MFSSPPRLHAALCDAAFVIAALAAASAAHAAGAVQVGFVAPERYTDAGDFGRSRDDNLRRLADHLQRLGQRGLADGQTLRIDVLDVDLAGRMKPLRSGGEVRVLRGGADWPRISLRYTLESAGAVVQRGEDTLADLNYLASAPARRSAEPLPDEMALLDAWFKRRFGGSNAQ